MKFGHRRTGYLSPNKIINAPIQGTAFHCLLWSLIQLNKQRKKEKWKTIFPGQIHDSIFSNIYPDERKHVLGCVKKVMCDDIRNEFDWIIVPLKIDIELAEVDQSWYYIKK